MPAIAHPRTERTIAAGILLAAVALAAWIFLRQPPELPLPRFERVESDAPLPAEAAETPPQNPQALAFEMVELPPMPTPAVSPKPAVAPPMPRLHVPEAKPHTPPQPEAPPPPVPLTPEPQPPVLAKQRAPILPLQPDEPRISILPLRPEPERPKAPARPVAPLPESELSVAEPDRPKSFVPLVPEPEPPKRIDERPPVLKPMPPVREVRIAAPAPLPRPEPQPTPAVPQSTRESAARAITAEAAGEGRVLLRMFEHGAGPGIQIRWPSEPSERDRLYDIFMRCFGMRVGIVDDNGRLYLPEGPPNQPSVLDMDRYSGFVRRPEGQIAAEEQREIARVRSYHRAADGAPARLFPRGVDAFLIGGLRQAVGEGYLQTKSIRAAYRLSGGRVMVDSILADGRPVAGTIDLSDAGRSCR